MKDIFRGQDGRNVTMLLVVASFGYFVDIFDLILFNLVSIDSFKALHLSDEQIKVQEIALFNYQMIGMMIGGILWGIWGDKKGRISVLFGSILLYSVANLLNAFVTNIPQYAILRFVAGLGLAGELGAAVTLINETMTKEKRGYGTMIIVTFGALGAVVAFLISKQLGWQYSYIAGGVLGLLLLVMRASAFESGMFKAAKESEVKKGDLLQIFTKRERFVKYLMCILIGLPVWYTVGILINLSPRFAEALQVQGKVLKGESIMYCYIGLSIGDLLSGMLSQWLRSRKKVILLYLVVCASACAYYLSSRGLTIGQFHFLCAFLGGATGFWALFVTNASEQFGTNLRATVTTTVPNFVRGALYLITLGFTFFSNLWEKEDWITGAWIMGVVSFGLAIGATLYVKETFAKDLNYWEVD